MRHVGLAILLAVLCTSAALGAPALQVDDLRCEYLHEPLGIDEPQPRLSWTLKSQQRGQRQTAYQVLVASSPEALERTKATCGTAAKWLPMRPPTSSMPDGRWFRDRPATGRSAPGIATVSPVAGASRPAGKWDC